MPSFKEEEKMLWYIKAQVGDVSVVGKTKEMTEEEAEQTPMAQVLAKTGSRPFIIEPICTQEQWEDRTINFCPRCGIRLYEPIESPYGGTDFDCTECDTSVFVSFAYEIEEDEE